MFRTILTQEERDRILLRLAPTRFTNPVDAAIAAKLENLDPIAVQSEPSKAEGLLAVQRGLDEMEAARKARVEAKVKA